MLTVKTCGTSESTFADHLAELRVSIDRRLDELLPESGNERDLIALAMRDSTLAPGKRMRPILLVLAANSLGHRGAQALELGCAVEMIHAASLVLDDMPCMDNAQLRRGRPTVHLKFGEDVAILTAIALLSRAFGVVAGIAELPAATRTQLVEVLANTVGMQGLVRGQFQDLRDGQQARSAEQIALTNTLKTGVLFGAIMDMAWLVSGATPCKRSPLQNFALELGQAFQLYDDLHDSSPDTAKDQGKDAGKSTLMALYGPEGVTLRLYEHLRKAQACLDEALGRDHQLGDFLQLIFAKVAIR
ncbi:polyprenyl synthetase family protein [Pseudomonas sp. DTU_2021_1001937_2_SI_NGA_ILE_001]|uniref:polyprenyl synthetase family protein n=1 Tax=Pseudomonas sp. DTU_2021_1001937_2_SI_NGA_ILE_001 TaxID=3077589 RepID=UPI0025D99CF3|nr:polyprenyl synthetase family protein [Pseudomonas sp. DTU_2021_1001937_2_SI_NGA_ILE_001]WNW10729.1 polyprenyl synthetase family protein [Pseudomonas sp. DTU_2021_1001937_2_SI_NGA_ILE_001]